MDPNQPQYSIDYLNQIAPQNQRRPVNKKALIAVVTGSILLVIIFISLIVAALGGGSGDRLQTLAARLKTLETISHNAQANIKSNSLRTTNSSLDVYLTTANRDIAKPLENQGVSAAKLDKAIVAKEAGTELTAKLNDANLNAIYDRTYAREMSYQLATVSALIADIDSSTSDEALKAYLKTTDANLAPIEDQLARFIDSSS